MGKIMLDIWWPLLTLHLFSYPQFFVDTPVIIFRKFYCKFISVINQYDAQNFCFTISLLFHASTCFENMCLSSGGQNCNTQPLVSSHLQVAVSCTGRPPVGVLIPEAV